MGKREKNAFDSNTKLNGKAFETEQGKYISNQQMKEFIKVKAYLDLFRRLLILANARHTNLRDVLLYELHVSPSPCSPVHNDGSLRKPIKSDPSVLEERSHCCPASLPAPAHNFIAHIMDGMAFIQVHKSIRASTFSASQLASTYFIIIVA